MGVADAVVFDGPAVIPAARRRDYGDAMWTSIGTPARISGMGGKLRQESAMTSWSRTAIPATMLRAVWLLILSLLAASLVATATVHARESLGTPAISCGGEIHTEGDRDQVPADADHGIPHHHGTCHGHAFALEADAQASTTRQRLSTQIFARRGHGLASLSVGPALRPPRT